MALAGEVVLGVLPPIPDRAFIVSGAPRTGRPMSWTHFSAPLLAIPASALTIPVPASMATEGASSCTREGATGPRRASCTTLTIEAGASRLSIIRYSYRCGDMHKDKKLKEQEKVRKFIAQKVQQLRKGRRWTQAELSKRLHLSQSRLSEIERGDGSFTAEQLLTILKLFNVSVSEFSRELAPQPSEVQNALARLGASHLGESTSVLPAERLMEAGDVLREALVTAESPRLIAALAPVLVLHIDSINLNRLHLQLTDAGFERRLAWLVENTIAAIVRDVATVSPVSARRPYRRAQVLLESFLAFLSAHLDGKSPAPDVLDTTIRSKQTLEEVREASSAISRRWGVITTLQPEDFAHALRSARDAHP